jgi:hypothetical protein
MAQSTSISDSVSRAQESRQGNELLSLRAAVGKFALPVLVLALVVGGVAGCSNVKLISDYDQQIDVGATRLAREMDRFLVKIEDKADTPQAEYEANREFYLDYEVELRSLLLRARSHPKNSQTEEQLVRMLDSLEALKTVHELGPLPEEQIDVTRDLFAQAWQGIITLEMAKKRGEN